jgi:hypothetical protein
MILALLAYLAVGFGTVTLYTLVILALCAGRAYRNGYAAGLEDAGRRRASSNVTVLPRQRGGAA